MSDEAFTIASDEALNTESAPTIATEIAPGRVLARLEISQLEHGMEIPKQLWEPLFGGEALETQLWDKILVNPGDSVILKGSSVVKFLFAGYAYNKQTGLADQSLRADIDAEIYQEEVLVRAQNLNGKNRTLASKVKVGDVEIDLNDQNKVREMLASELKVLGSQLQAEKITEAINTLETNPAPGVVFLLNSFAKHESIGIRLYRDENYELKAEIADMLGALNEFSLNAGSVTRQMEIQIETAQHGGVVFRNQNPISIYQYYLEAARWKKVIEYENIAIPFYTAANITRMMRAACELRVFQNGSPSHDNYSGAIYYEDVYNLAYMLSHNLNPFVARNAGAEAENLEEKLHAEFQKDFARAAAADINQALWHIFVYMPMGKYVSEDLARNYEDVLRIRPPNNDLRNLLDGLYISHGNIQKVEEALINMDEETIKNMDENLFLDNLTHQNLLDAVRHTGIRTLLKADALEMLHYKPRIVEMRPITDLAGKARPMYHHDRENAPTSMDEVIGLLLVAADWDPEKDTGKIQMIVDNWKTSGKLKLAWKTHDVEFETGLTVDGIKEKMKMFRQYDLSAKPAESPSP